MEQNNNQVSLTSITSEMYKSIYAWRSDPITKKYNPLVDIDFEKFCDVVQSFSSDFNEFYNKANMRWAVVQNDNLVGLVGVKDINSMMQTAELAYSISPKCRGKGLGKQSVSLLIEQIFKETKIRRLTALVASENIASCKILLSLGFKEEGLLREHFLIDGKSCHEKYFGLLKNEFTPLDQTY